MSRLLQYVLVDDDMSRLTAAVVVCCATYCDGRRRAKSVRRGDAGNTRARGHDTARSILIGCDDLNVLQLGHWFYGI